MNKKNEQNEKVPVIQAFDLTIGYGSIIIGENLNFNIYKNEIITIVGGSGCGKSTLMRNLIGLEIPLNGDVIIDGDSIVTSDEKVQKHIMKKIGVLFQSGALFGSLTIAENVRLPIKEYTSLPTEAVELLVKMKLGMVGLSGYENYLPSEISGGMKKRAGLARAMALDPMLLFFDEPSAGLDPVTSAELDNTILQINASLGTTIIVVTHELPSIFTIADRVIMLSKNTKGIIADGTPEQLKNDSSNSEAYAFFNRKPKINYNTG